MNWIDIACAALILLIMFFGFMRGLFSVLIHIAAYILSLIGADVIAKFLSPYLYEKFFQARVLTNLRIALPSGSVSGSVNEIIQKVTASLPSPFPRIVSYFDFSKLIAENASAGTSLTVDEIEQLYVNPILTKILAVIAFLVCFILLSLILRIIAGMIDRGIMKRKGVIPTVNKILGGVVGLVKGLVPVAVVCAILNLVAPILNISALSELVENSFFCQTVLKILS